MYSHGLSAQYEEKRIRTIAVTHSCLFSLNQFMKMSLMGRTLMDSKCFIQLTLIKPVRIIADRTCFVTTRFSDLTRVGMQVGNTKGSS